MHPAPDTMHPLWFQIGISPWGALGVLIGTVVLYLVYTALMHRMGPRLMAAPSVLSFTLIALFGAITARAMLGNSPTLAGALIALTTLVVLEAMLGRLRDSLTRMRSLHGPGPVVVMVHGHVVEASLRRRHLSRTHLFGMLRRAGIHRVEDVELAILENKGTLTVIRAGEKVDRELLADVEGARLIPPHLFR